MGFWIMLLSSLIGLGLVIFGVEKELPKGQKIAFWEGRHVYDERKLTVWSPVANVSGPMQCAEIKYLRGRSR